MSQYRSVEVTNKQSAAIKKGHLFPGEANDRIGFFPSSFSPQSFPPPCQGIVNHSLSLSAEEGGRAKKGHKALGAAAIKTKLTL